MTAEQLTQLRAEAWRQAGNPLLTADDATAWLRETGVCLFVPRSQQLAAAAPSFVEATLGHANAAPERAAIDSANEVLHRLLTAGDAIALNLIGTHGAGLPGDQPDFLATPETLPFVFALVGDKEWKRGPRGKSSPLTIEVWKLLSSSDVPLTAEEVKDKLGRQLTEVAALRALSELWSHLRIEPLYAEGAPARWQLLERSHGKQMQAGSTLSQAAALSALVSLYLQSAVAASADEIEVFLSPLASRSKVRDVVKGLTATRQLSTLNLGPVELFHVEGSLPEFPEIARHEGAVIEDLGRPGISISAEEGGIGEGRRRFVARRLDAGEESAKDEARAPSTAKPAARRPSSDASRRAASSDRPPTRGDRDTGDRRPFAPRPPASGTGGERRPYGTRSTGTSFNPREPWKEEGKAPPRREEGAGSKEATPRGEGAPRAGRTGGERRAFASGAGNRKPYTPREGGERRPSASLSGDRPFKPRGEVRPFGDRKPFTSRGTSDRKPFSPRKDGPPGERRPFVPREDGSADSGRKSYAARSGDRPYKTRSDAKPDARKSFGDRKPAREGAGRTDGKPFTPRSGNPPFKPRAGGKPFGDSKPYTPREGKARTDGKPFTPRSGDRPFKPRADGKPFGDRKPYTLREGAARGDSKPFTPRSGDRPFKPRSGAKPLGDRKPFTPREGAPRSDSKPITSRSGDRPFKPRAGGKPFGDRKPFTPREGAGRSDRKPFTPREGAPSSERRPAPGGPRRSSTSARPAGAGPRKTTGASRARTSSFTSSGKPRSGVKPVPGRPGPRATRGAAAKGGLRSGLKRPGKPGKGRSK